MKKVVLFVLLSLIPLAITLGRWRATRLADSPLPPVSEQTIAGNDDKAGMVLVSAGPFVMGSDESPDQLPLRRIDLPAFWIDRTEVAAADFDSFLREKGIAPPASPLWKDGILNPELADHPAYPVTWAQARDYCRARGKRLPSEAEWEKAARGTDSRIYPWGDNWDPMRCNNSDLNIDRELKSRPVGSFSQGTSPYGAMDMAGNVREWIADRYDPQAYEHRRWIVPPFWMDMPHGIRGGSFFSNQRALSTPHRSHGDISSPGPDIGFRCVKSN